LECGCGEETVIFRLLPFSYDLLKIVFAYANIFTNEKSVVVEVPDMPAVWQ
jgi:hypothetical protein